MSKYRVSIKSTTTNRRSFLHCSKHWWKCIIHVSQTRSSISQTNFPPSPEDFTLSNVFVNRFRKPVFRTLAFLEIETATRQKRCRNDLSSPRIESILFDFPQGFGLDTHSIRGAFNSLTRRDQPATVQGYPPLVTTLSLPVVSSSNFTEQSV